jgi:two-component system capsular synthesis response regulator RcsB
MLEGTVFKHLGSKILSGESVRVLLLDDHALVRHGLATFLGQLPGFEVVGECASSRELMVMLARTQVDLLLLDYSLGADSADGLHLIRMLHVRFPKIKILVISAHGSPATAAMALRAGAGGFMGKSRELKELPEAIRSVMKGRAYVSHELAQALPALHEPADSEPSSDTWSDLIQCAPLTSREREVLRCCLDGLSVSDIAKKFSRSVKTISGHKQNAFRKLGVATDHELFKLSHLI